MSLAVPGPTAKPCWLWLSGLPSPYFYSRAHRGRRPLRKQQLRRPKNPSGLGPHLKRRDRYTRFQQLLLKKASHESGHLSLRLPVRTDHGGVPKEEQPPANAGRKVTGLGLPKLVFRSPHHKRPARTRGVSVPGRNSVLLCQVASPQKNPRKRCVLAGTNQDCTGAAPG
jgi:hypothetical protein